MKNTISEKKEKNQLEVAKRYLDLGRFYIAFGNFDLAQYNLNKAKNELQELPPEDQKDLALIEFDYSHINFLQGNYDKSIESYSQILTGKFNKTWPKTQKEIQDEEEEARRLKELEELKKRKEEAEAKRLQEEAEMKRKM